MKDRQHPALAELSSLDIGQLLWNEPLSRHSSWRIGGPADLLVEPSSLAQISTLCRYLHKQRLPLVVIGQGTNLLFDDAGVRGVVLKLGAALSQVQLEGTKIIADAGAWVPRLARMTMRAGLGGLEHCIGIPGTLGGLVLMNGGSQRRSIGENIRRVWLVGPEGDLQVLAPADCAFGYRHSNLAGRGVVVRAELECPPGDPAAIRQAMLFDLRERRRKFPRKIPNCGSVFLSTAEMHASVGPPGKIIEEAGLKGARIGGAEVSRLHANFILNKGGATAAEVLELIALVRMRVRQKIDFDLRCEARFVRFDGRIIPADQAQPSQAEET